MLPAVDNRTARIATIKLLRLSVVAALLLPALLFCVASYLNYREASVLADERIGRSLDVQQEQALVDAEDGKFVVVAPGAQFLGLGGVTILDGIGPIRQPNPGLAMLAAVKAADLTRVGPRPGIARPARRPALPPAPAPSFPEAVGPLLSGLLDMLKETDLRVHFSDAFRSATAFESMDRATLQQRLLLCL